MSTTTIHLCPDCGKPLHEEYYERPANKSYSTFTCQTKGCLLEWVTLSLDGWLTKDLEAYRKMNRGNK